MKKMSVVALGMACLLTSVGLYLLMKGDDNQRGLLKHTVSSTEANSSTHDAINAKQAALDPTHGTGVHASPFELGNAGAQMAEQIAGESKSATKNMLEMPAPEVVSPAEAARRKKLEQLGYMLPPDYYTKDLKALKRMAKTGDAFAMMHMGEKYYFELQGQPSHPEFDKNMDYAKAAKTSFQDALIAGNIRSAGIIAELYYQEKNALEAYAWHLVSDQLGDDISADWFRRTDMAQNSSADLKQAAAERAAQILNELKIKKKV